LKTEYGIILIDKPIGITSFRVVQILRKITGIRKIGHTGTLDPFASGLLPVCIGKATRTVNMLSDKPKTYRAKLKFGEKTDTGDIEGNIMNTVQITNLTEENIKRIANQMLKITEQIPPKYSAKKVNGQRAYKLARNNIDFELCSVPIEIKEFQIIRIELPFVTYETTVSKGTYIRSLSETFAEKCGSIAVTTELKRTKIGNLKLENSVSMENITEKNWKDHLIDLKDIFTDFPKVIVKNSDIKKFRNGNEIVTNAKDAEKVIIVNEEGACIGFGNVYSKLLKAKWVFI